MESEFLLSDISNDIDYCFLKRGKTMRKPFSVCMHIIGYVCAVFTLYFLGVKYEKRLFLKKLHEADLLRVEKIYKGENNK